MDVVKVPAEDNPEDLIGEVDAVLKKQQRIEKEKKELLASLATGDFSSQRSRVAAILNQYPASRNSDVTLALKYWSTFQPIYIMRRVFCLVICLSWSGCITL